MRGKDGGGGVYSIFMHGGGRMTIWYRPSHAYNAGTEHVGFPPTRRDEGNRKGRGGEREKGGGGDE